MKILEIVTENTGDVWRIYCLQMDSGNHFGPTARTLVSSLMKMSLGAVVVISNEDVMNAVLLLGKKTDNFSVG